MPVVKQNGLSFGFDEGQDDWGVRTNNTIRHLAYVGINISVRNVGLTSPPASPIAGDSYLVGANATGAWSGIPEHTLVVWGYDEATGNTPAVSATPAWQRFTPRIGYLVYDQQNSRVLIFGGTTWEELQNQSFSVNTNSTLVGNGNNIALGINPANLFTATEKSKLSGIELGATRDQSAPEIRNLLQNLSGSNRLPYSAIDTSNRTPTYSDAFSVLSDVRVRSRQTGRIKIGTLRLFEMEEEYWPVWEIWINFHIHTRNMSSTTRMDIEFYHNWDSIAVGSTNAGSATQYFYLRKNTSASHWTGSCAVEARRPVSRSGQSSSGVDLFTAASKSSDVAAFDVWMYWTNPSFADNFDLTTGSSFSMGYKSR